MRAVVLEQARRAVRLTELLRPAPGEGQLLVRVCACAVCRTDLHVVDGELPDPKWPLVPGHEVVGIVEEVGPGVESSRIGMRVGIGWLGWTCGTCVFCRTGRENLCNRARFTGYQLDGGYAEYAVADERYCFPLPEGLDDVHAAPLLCAGVIGYRALKFTGDAQRVGLYGFGAAAHLIAQVLAWQGRKAFAFTRPHDVEAQRFARELGCVWAGDSTELPPEKLDAAVLFAPVGALVPAAVSTVDKGGVVVCAGIHMSDIPSFPYSLLWGERVVRSVANLTRADTVEFLSIAPKVPVRTHVQTFPLEQANEALGALREGKLLGAAVLVP